MPNKLYSQLTPGTPDFDDLFSYEDLDDNIVKSVTLQEIIDIIGIGSPGSPGSGLRFGVAGEDDTGAEVRHFTNPGDSFVIQHGDSAYVGLETEIYMDSNQIQIYAQADADRISSITTAGASGGPGGQSIVLQIINNGTTTPVLTQIEMGEVVGGQIRLTSPLIIDMITSAIDVLINGGDAEIYQDATDTFIYNSYDSGNKVLQFDMNTALGVVELSAIDSAISANCFVKVFADIIQLSNVITGDAAYLEVFKDEIKIRFLSTNSLSIKSEEIYFNNGFVGLDVWQNGSFIGGTKSGYQSDDNNPGYGSRNTAQIYADKDDGSEGWYIIAQEDRATIKRVVGGANTAMTEYADNTAAVAGGLEIGDLYRTGDLLKIVH